MRCHVSFVCCITSKWNKNHINLVIGTESDTDTKIEKIVSIDKKNL